MHHLIPALLIFNILTIVSGQTPPDVSVVKLHPDHAPCVDVRVVASGQLEAGCFSLELVIREGLGILPNQLSGGPEWVRHDRWDISAKAASLAAKPAEQIYRRLLLGVAFQRFSLKLHSAKPATPRFALLVAEKGKPGPGLKPNHGQPHSFDVKPGPSLTARAITMRELATGLRIPAGAAKTVADQTGLTGLCDVHLRWTPLRSSRTPDPNAEPVIFPALRDQLGLKLVPAQVEQDAYEIQAAERPVSN